MSWKKAQVHIPQKTFPEIRGEAQEFFAAEVELNQVLAATVNPVIKQLMINAGAHCEMKVDVNRAALAAREST